MSWFVASGAALFSLSCVGQSHFDALLRILSEFEGFDAFGEVEEVRLNRRKIELGAGEEAQGRRPNAGRADRALDGERLALKLPSSTGILRPMLMPTKVTRPPTRA